MMRSFKKYWFLLVLMVLAGVTSADAIRIARPDTFSLPWNKDQISRLNDLHNDIWNLQNGEFNLDIVSTTKSNANNGDFWLIQTGTVVYLQYKGNDHVFTITPDGF